jgi:hypothetical protein
MWGLEGREESSMRSVELRRHALAREEGKLCRGEISRGGAAESGPLVFTSVR